jgi:hypothetical protein
VADEDALAAFSDGRGVFDVAGRGESHARFRQRKRAGQIGREPIPKAGSRNSIVATAPRA